MVGMRGTSRMPWVFALTAFVIPIAPSVPTKVVWARTAALSTFLIPGTTESSNSASEGRGRRVDIRGSNVKALLGKRVKVLATAACVAGSVLAPVASHMVSAGATTSTTTTVSPTYVRTVGHPGHADLYPSGVDVDPSGNVYVADTGNDRVEKYAPGSNVPTWSIGTRGGTTTGNPISFENPRDIAVSSTHVYVADTDNGVIQVLNLDGTWSSKFSMLFKSPIGITVGSDGAGRERILVSDGATGNIYVFDSLQNLVLTVPPTATLEGTRDAATDSAGNIYSADYRNNRVDKYSPTGTLLLQWGGATAPACQQVTAPYGVAVDQTNHIYVASSTLEVVKEFNADGSCVGSYGVPGTASNQVFQLRRVAVGAGTTPQVYLADIWGIKVLVYNHDGTLARTLGSWPAPLPGGLNEAHGVAVSASFVYVTDTVNQRITRFNLDGSNPIVWGVKGVESKAFNWAQGIGINPASGNLWVADTRNNRLEEYGPDGSGPLRLLGTRTGGSTVLFNWPTAVAFDSAGNMYVADTFANRIQSFSVTPTTITHRWSVGIIGKGIEQFNKPYGIAFDGVGGRILVADTRNNRIVSLNPATGAWNGVLPIVKGVLPGEVTQPQGVTTAPDGSIWVADTSNNRIEKFAASGSFANEILGGTAFGNLNTQFNAPQGLQIGPDGHLYVADDSNDRIQVFQP